MKLKTLKIIFHILIIVQIITVILMFVKIETIPEYHYDDSLCWIPPL